MTVPNAPSLSSRQARVAGFLYLPIIICGISSEVFIRSQLIVSGDAGATAGNILAAGPLFRLGFFLDSVMLLCDVALAVALYLIFRPVSHALSLTAAAFRLTQAAVLGVNLLCYYAAWLVLTVPSYAGSFDTAQLGSLAMLALDLHGHGYDLGLLFFGISNLILGYLIIRSRLFPGILGYGLIAAAVVYLLGGYVRFMVPDLYPAMQPAYLVPLIAELAFCLWLLTKGVGVAEAGNA